MELGKGYSSPGWNSEPECSNKGVNRRVPCADTHRPNGFPIHFMCNSKALLRLHNLTKILFRKFTSSFSRGFKSRPGMDLPGHSLGRSRGLIVENVTNGRTLLKSQRIWPYWKV